MINHLEKRTLFTISSTVLTHDKPLLSWVKHCWKNKPESAPKTIPSRVAGTWHPLLCSGCPQKCQRLVLLFLLLSIVFRKMVLVTIIIWTVFCAICEHRSRKAHKKMTLAFFEWDSLGKGVELQGKPPIVKQCFVDERYSHGTAVLPFG